MDYTANQLMRRGGGINRHVAATPFRGRHWKGNRKYCNEIVMYLEWTTQQKKTQKNTKKYKKYKKYKKQNNKKKTKNKNQN